VVRFIRTIISFVLLACALPLFAAAPQAGQTQSPKDQMFSGVVTAVSPNSLTAVRIGSKDATTFVITEETKFEGGAPQVNSRVTVRYITTEEGIKAVRVIVRGTAKK
jgi:hypothetical protein